MHGDINSQIREVMEVEITGKRKKGRPRKWWEECVKIGQLNREEGHHYLTKKNIKVCARF